MYELAIPVAEVLGYSGVGGGGPRVVEPDRDGKYRVWVSGFSWGSDRPNAIVPVKLIGKDGVLGFEQQGRFHTLGVFER